MAQVLALVDDLFFQAKLLETAKHVGVELRCVATAATLLDEARRSAPALVVIDLNARGGGIEAVQQIQRDNPWPVIGFLSHVQTELAERARQAGCHEVMPRSKFTQDLAAILSRAKTPANTQA